MRDYMRVNAKMAIALFGANIVVLAASMIASRLIPAGPDTNRKVPVVNSRYTRTPLPGTRLTLAEPVQHAHGDTGPAGAVMTGGAMSV